MKKIIFFACFLWVNHVSFAQQTESVPTPQWEEQLQTLQEKIGSMQKLNISGYIQTQFQSGQQDASLKVGSGNTNKKESFNRMGIRRGRIKFTYTEGLVSGVFQLDVTEKGVGFKDAYLNMKDPWGGTNALRAGVFDRPFGYEIGYSSSRRESPERSRVFQTLFPDERDLGVMLVLQPSKTSAWNFLKLEAGLFAGNGIKSETDNRKDFIGHLSAQKSINSSIQAGLGFSYYDGSVYQGTNNVYTMQGGSFVADSRPENKGQFAKRRYFGIDGQFAIITRMGTTQLRGEYLWGKQPGELSGSKSPNASTPGSTDTYLRDFRGGYIMGIQDLGESPLSAVLKYEWYDPNTKLSGDLIGKSGTNTGKGDIAYRTFGFGLLWRATANIRLQAYYEVNKNETSSQLSGFESDRKDDVFTLRLQYKF